MPRIRTIKPEFWSSPGVTSMNPWARLTFIALWNWSDDFGRGTCEMRELHGFVFPRDEEMTVGEFRRHVGEIRRHVGVKFYKVAGRPYFEIPTWDKHQKIDKRLKGSRYPGPEEGELFDPATDQPLPAETSLSENPADMYGNFPDMYGNSTETQGITPPGTGEQGNRGTGEGGSVGSNHKDAHAGETEIPSPEFSGDPIDEAFAAFDAGPPAVESDDPLDWCTPEHPRCRDHAHIPPGEDVPPCRACGNVRQHFEDQDRQAIAEHHAAVNACSWCDDRGLVATHTADGRPIALQCDHSGPPPEIPADEGHRELSSREKRRHLITQALDNPSETRENGPQDDEQAPIGPEPHSCNYVPVNSHTGPERKTA